MKNSTLRKTNACRKGNGIEEREGGKEGEEGEDKRSSKSRSRVIRIQRQVYEPISSGRGAEQRSMERNYQSPARFRHVAAVVLPLLSRNTRRTVLSLNVSAVSLLTSKPHLLLHLFSLILSHLLCVPRDTQPQGTRA